MSDAIEKAFEAIRALVEEFSETEECCPQCGDYPCECGLVPDAKQALATIRGVLAEKAAPDLLYALETLYALVIGECPSLLEDDHHDGLVRDAIAKARCEAEKSGCSLRRQ